jgi:uncharacterized membrane protein
MQIDGLAVIGILGMALVTYATRAGGVWLVGWVRPSRQVEAALRQVPGAVLMAIVAPAVLQSGLAGLLAVVATATVVRRTGNLLLAITVGVAVVWALRRVL